MTDYKSDFLRILAERGFIHQTSNDTALDDLLVRETVTAYIGFDCTADSLHAGSLLGIMMLRWLQKTGHRPIALMGGGTTRVGDPTGKDESRKVLSEDEIEVNKAAIKKNFSNFISFGDGATEALMLDNADWLMHLNYLDFLREFGRHFSVNAMMQRDAVKLRLEREQHLSFLEFNYMILQAYDFYELNQRHGCRLQMGGSDQWGNIVSGVDLGRRAGTPDLYALTCPLLATASGAKMGKTAAGAVWLSPDRLSPYDYWQYWRNCEDADVGKFLRLFTELPLDEIARLESVDGAALNESKKVLANEATAMLHGKDRSVAAAETARRTFEEGMTATSLPSVDLPDGALDPGLGVLAGFVLAGLCASNGEARRAVKGGALRVNDLKVSDERQMLTSADLADGAIKLSMGKKKHILLKI